MGLNNIDFKLLSLNVRGIRSFEKRKSVFNWLCKSRADICFLQETYSTKEVEMMWKKQWKGDIFFSHGSSHSKGVLVLIRDSLDFNLKSVKVDALGRYILLEATIQDSPFLLLNIYAPNKCAEQCEFFKSISNELNAFMVSEYSVVLGGDFNVVFDQDLDGSGGIKKVKDSVKVLEDICLEQDLLDIWRVRNPMTARFTWRQKTPIIQRRLDFWLISDSLQEDVDRVDIIPSIKSDHSAITLSFSGVEDGIRGPSFWKFNSSLVNDQDYCDLLDENLKGWLEDFKDVVDKRVLWDLLKYKIRQLTINYSKTRARSRREKESKLEEKLREYTKKCDIDPTKQNMEELECAKAEYEEFYDYVTQGAIIRSRATWYEKGEKNNKYFLNLEKSNKKRSSVRKIFLDDGKLTTNPKTILSELEFFYSNLYKDHSCHTSESTFFDIEVPSLSQELRSACEGRITYNECFSALQSFQKNKTPGNDGLTAEFYLAFWSLFGKYMVDSIDYSYEFGELSNSQKQAIITLIDKKGKDKRMIKNWRPISLINVDTKIISKVLAKRLEKVLPSIIHANQNAFVKGRSIFDAIRTIDDMVDYTERNNLSGFLIAIDFEKAFDTLNFNFLIRTLHKFNFGPSFIHWIRVLYNNVSSCVMNNGFTTASFSLSRGVRQGDPLSPYLFIIALEILAERIRSDSNIHGFRIGEETVKLSLFADDMTCFLRDGDSYTTLCQVLECFGDFSGLKVNHEKTEMLALGNNTTQVLAFAKHKVCETIKILGVYFGYNLKQRHDLNFTQTLKAIKKSINMWKWRNLSLIGRIQIVKTFAIPKLMYRASVIAISNELVKEVNSILYGFIWNGKDKVKRQALISDQKKGGLKMLDIDSMIKAKRVTLLKKFLEDYPSPWKTIFNKLLSPIGGCFVLHCNFDVSKLKIQLPAYYKECLDAWSDLNGKKPSSSQEVLNEIIWNNKFLCVEKRSVYRKDLIDLGFLRIGDLISVGSSFSLDFLTPLISPEQRFFLMSIINSIPAEWRTLAKTSINVSLLSAPIPSTLTIKTDNGNFTAISDVSSKQIYQLFIEKKQIPPTAKQKLQDKYSDTAVDWEKVYSLAFNVTLESKLREFQYKILNCIVYTNEKLFRFGLTDSPCCTFCQEDIESIEHLFFSCKVTSDFWKHVLSWLRGNGIQINTLKETDLIFGKFDNTEDFILINHMLLLGKFYLYSSRCQKIGLPNLSAFIARTKRIYNIEHHIARENNKLLQHLKKWEKLIHLFQ